MEIVEFHMNLGNNEDSVRSTVPKTMLAAVTASSKRRRGMVVESLSAVAGSSEVAMSAAALPPPMAVASRDSLVPARHNDAICY